MTTPTIDFVMPYGVTVEGDGVTRIATPVTKSKNLRSGWVSLMPGPCRVAVSWSGPETVRLVLAGVGYPATIPAGGGIGPRWLLSVPRRATGSISKASSTGRSPRAHAALSRSTPSTPSSAPRRGGGVGGASFGAGGEATQRRHRHNAVCPPTGGARSVFTTACGGVRSGGDVAGAGAGGGGAFTDPNVGEPTGSDRSSGAVGDAGAGGTVPYRIRKGPVGVLPVLRAVGFSCAFSSTGDSSDPDVRGATAAGGSLNGRPCEHSGDHHLLHRVERQHGGVPEIWRVPAPLHGCTDNLGDGARRHRVSTPVHGFQLQGPLPHEKNGRRPNGGTPERVTAGGGDTLPVVLLRHRRGGLLRHDPEVLDQQGVVA